VKLKSAWRWWFGSGLRYRCSEYSCAGTEAAWLKAIKANVDGSCNSVCSFIVSADHSAMCARDMVLIGVVRLSRTFTCSAEAQASASSRDLTLPHRNRLAWLEALGDGDGS